MWRGTMQAARSLEHLASGPDGGRRRVHRRVGARHARADRRSSSRGAAATRSAGLMGDIRPCRAVLAITADRGRRPRRASRGPGGRGSTTRSARRPAGAPGTGSPTLRPDRLGGRLAPDARRRDAAGVVRGGRRRRRTSALRRVRGRPARRSTSGPTGARWSRRTRWARHGPGGPADDYPCDPWGRVRTPEARAGSDGTIRGLYVGDASLFPTAIGVNPMITTMVWARRVARTVLAEGRRPAERRQAGVRPRTRRSARRLDLGRGSAGAAAAPRLHPAPRRDDQDDRGDDHDAGHDRARRDSGSPRIRRAEEHGDDRVHVGVGGDPRQRRHGRAARRRWCTRRGCRRGAGTRAPPSSASRPPPGRTRRARR